MQHECLLSGIEKPGANGSGGHAPAEKRLRSIVAIYAKLGVTNKMEMAQLVQGD